MVSNVDAVRCSASYLFVGGEYGEACSRGFMLIRRAHCPESNRSAAKLSKPTFQFRLCSVMRQAAHMEDFALFCQKGLYISSGVHRSTQDLRVLMRRLGLADQASEDSSEGDCFLQCPTRGRWCEGLQMKWQIVFDRS